MGRKSQRTVSADRLRHLYEDCGMTLVEVAAELGCVASTVHTWLAADGVARRKSKMCRPSKVTIDGDVAYVALTALDVAIVDKADVTKVSGNSWCVSGTGYAHAKVGGRMVYMHALITGEQPDGRVTDHINRDKLDNRRANLRAVSRGQNARNRPKTAANTTGYRNVYRRGGKYRARVVVDGKRHHIGTFDDPAEASQAAIAWRLEHDSASVTGCHTA